MASDHKLVHYSRKKLDELRSLTYEELVQDRTSGRWLNNPELAAKYVEDRRRFEKALHKRLAAKSISTKPDTSFLYATLSGHERFGDPDQYRHEAELTPELINSSFFDVVGADKPRTTFGQRGLVAALKKWKDAEKANTLKEQEYMGMAIKPRIEVITPNSVRPGFVSGGSAVKTAAPKWLKLLRSGLLSPEALNRVTAALPEGTARYVKNLGRGQSQLADLVVGNIKGAPPGLAVRKLPTYIQNINQMHVNQLAASKALEKKVPGAAARYFPSNPAKGIMQEYGTKVVNPEWAKALETINKDPLDIAANRIMAKTVVPLQTAGASDLHTNNFGPGGQLIDYMYKLPKNQLAGQLDSSAPIISAKNQNMLRPGYNAAADKVDNKYMANIGGIGRYPYQWNFNKIIKAKNLFSTVNDQAVRKYWLGNRVPIKGDEAVHGAKVVNPDSSLYNTIQESIGKLPKFKIFPGFKQFGETIKALPGIKTFFKNSSAIAIAF